MIGYYSIASLKTEEQIYDEFTINEDYDLLLELEGQEEAEREREAQFEQNLKSRMKLKAEEVQCLRTRFRPHFSRISQLHTTLNAPSDVPMHASDAEWCLQPDGMSDSTSLGPQEPRGGE